MPSDKRNERIIGAVSGAVSRRKFLKQVAAGAGGSVLASGVAFAQSAETIKVGFVSPRTGPLGGFGEGDPYVLGLARKALAGGLMAGGKKYKVEIIDRDSQSDPARASQLAKALINSDKVDLMLTTSTPEVVNPVSDACEAAGVPCVSTVLPWEAWYFGRGAKPGEPSPFKWTYHFSFGVAEFAKAYISEWSNGQVPTNKKVGVMYPNDADGNALRAHMIPIIEKAGFSVFDPGRLRGRHHGLLVADCEVQGRGCADIHRRAYSARFCDFLAAISAARFCENDQDPEYRENRIVPVTDGSARLACL